MKDYKISSKHRFSSKSNSKGSQEKYYRNGYYYKINKMGNEGFVEYLVSEILKCSTMSDSNYVTYSYCKINNKFGCRSKSFLRSEEEFVTISKLYEIATGNLHLSDKLMEFSTAVERLQYIDWLIETFGIDKYEFNLYLQRLLQLDRLILNKDRHENNYGIIKIRNTYRIAPIFDNGLSLMTDKDITPCSCTLSGSFDKQIVAFGFPIEPAFKIKYKMLMSRLREIQNQYNFVELQTLLNNIEANSYLFV